MKMRSCTFLFCINTKHEKLLTKVVEQDKLLTISRMHAGHWKGDQEADFTLTPFYFLETTTTACTLGKHRPDQMFKRLESEKEIIQGRKILFR